MQTVASRREMEGSQDAGVLGPLGPPRAGQAKMGQWAFSPETLQAGFSRVNQPPPALPLSKTVPCWKGELGCGTSSRLCELPGPHFLLPPLHCCVAVGC
jgi:hypothetical protein